MHRGAGVPYRAPLIDAGAISRLLQRLDQQRDAGLTDAAAGVTQAKLPISQPGDEQEQEADRVSEQMVRMPEPTLPQKSADDDSWANGHPEQPEPGLDLLQTKREGASDVGQTAASTVDNEPLRSPGQPLEPATRAFFEPRFGHDLSPVRVHSSASAQQSALEMNARAYTVGQHIVFGAGQYAPGTHEGRRLIAHELTHVAQQCEGRAPPGRVHRLSSAHGQHVSGGLGDLTADLTSPVVINRTVHLHANFGSFPIRVPFTGPPALAPIPYPYDWEVKDRSTGAVVAQTSTQTNDGEITYPRAGQFSITCTLRTAAGSGSVSMDQDAVAEDTWLSRNLSTSNVDGDTLRELVDDFRQYVIDSATSTGANGITALFLAAILSEEISNTDPSLLFVNNKKARISEIQDVDTAIQHRAAGQSVPVSDLDHSVGVAQIKLSTAAQQQNVIPWTEQDPANRAPARAQIRSDFSALSTTQQENLLTLLRWPKSNIQAAAELLARLKNRSNRYPTLTRSAFGASNRACQIIATEYNLGASNSAEANAKPSSYGTTIWTRMADAVLAHYFPNT